MKTSISFVFSVLSACAFAETSTLQTVDSSGTTSFTTDANWSGGHAPTTWFEGVENIDFVMPHGGVRMPDSEKTYYGKSFQLGTAVNVASCYIKCASQTFQNDGLVFVRGVLGNWLGSRTSHIAGKVSVALQGCTSFNVTSEQTGLMTALVFDGPVSCVAADQTLQVNASSLDKRYTVSFLGGLSDFNGKLSAQRSGYVRVESTTCPGTFDVAADAALGTSSATSVVDVAHLRLANGARLLVPLGSASVGGATVPANGLLRATGDAVIPSSAKIPVDFAGTVLSSCELDAEPRRHAILAVPQDTGLSADAFVFETTEVGSARYAGLPTMTDPVVVSEEGQELLAFSTRRVATYTVNDPGGKSGFREVDFGNWTGHSEGGTWNSDWDYFVENKTLRVPEFAEDTQVDFGGHMLGLYKGTFVLKGCAVMNIPDLRVCGTSISHWGGVVKNLDKYPYAKGGTAVLKGSILIYPHAAGGLSSSMSFTGDSARHTRIESEIAGAGDILFQANAGSNTTTCGPFGESLVAFELAGTNTNFTGRITLATQTAKDGDGNQVMPSTTNHAMVVVSDPRNLGHTDTLVYDRVLLKQHGTIRVRRDVVLDDATCGFRVYDHGCFDAETNTCLTLASPLTVDGTLHKIGDGTLRMRNPLAFGTNVGTPTEGRNLLAVHAGALSVATNTACDGLKLSFDAGSALLVESTSPAESLYDVKTETPFDLSACPNGKVPVTMAFPDGETVRSRTAVVCTVSSSASLTVGDFSMKTPRGLGAKFSVADNGDGTKTFSVTVAPVYFSMYLR